MTYRNIRRDMLIDLLLFAFCLVALAVGLLFAQGCAASQLGPSGAGGKVGGAGGGVATGQAAALLWPLAITGSLTVAAGVVNRFMGGGTRMLWVGLAVAAAPPLVLLSGLEFAHALRWPVALTGAACGLLAVGWLGGRVWLGWQAGRRAAGIRQAIRTGAVNPAVAKQAEGQAEALKWVGPAFDPAAPLLRGIPVALKGQKRRRPHKRPERPSDAS